MTEVLRDTLVVPASLFGDDGLSGFGMDIGGSLMKVAYPTRHGDKIHINFVSFAKSEVVPALQVLKGLLAETMSPGAEVYTTGVGCNTYAKLINEVLDVRIVNKMESDCNTAALKFMMENLNFEDCVHPPCLRAYPALSAEVGRMEMMKSMLPPGGLGGVFDDFGTSSDAFSTFPSRMLDTSESIHAKSNDESTGDGGSQSCDTQNGEPDLEMSNIQLPALMYYLGSGQFFTTVFPDYTYKFHGINTSCGRTFMGMASLLTGVKTFDELLSLAEAGDTGNVDTRCKHLKNPDVQDMYAMLPDETTIYSFGQTVGKDLSDFSKEDIAAALVAHTALLIAQCCHNLYLTSQARTVLFFGGLCSESQYVRDEITRHFGFCLFSKPKTTKTNYYFLKYGSFLGALGALIWKEEKPE